MYKLLKDIELEFKEYMEIYAKEKIYLHIDLIGTKQRNRFMAILKVFCPTRGIQDELLAYYSDFKEKGREWREKFVYSQIIRFVETGECYILDKYVPENIIDSVMTFAEATEKWGLADSTLRKLVTTNKLVENVDYRKSKSTWLITEEAMIKIYGEPKTK